MFSLCIVMTIEETQMNEKTYRNKRNRKYKLLYVFSFFSCIIKDRKQRMGNYWLTYRERQEEDL